MGAKYKGLKITSGRRKLHYLWAPLYILVWILLFYLVTFIFHSLPDALTIEKASTLPDRFIAERAQKNLLDLTKIGPRVVGSPANEQAAVQFLIKEVEKIKQESGDEYIIETDLQVASGSYFLNKMVNMYQGIQNFIVKLTPKSSTSNSSLLINSHFDSVPGSPGGGDDGMMVVVMLEILRVLSQSENPLKHSIVFLFNGAEENPLQGSHAFIKHHKWATNVKAFINLDSAGNGGKEVLFQSGPSHPWLMNYYHDNVIHPFASTTAEELFQNNFIPSDTDFRIFRDFGKIPGLDFAHSYNGYVYHTKYDRFEIIPPGTYQNTGDNILAMAKALANASELEDPSAHREGHTVFYDFLGLFFIFYTETEGIIINTVVCIAAVIAICISMWCMTGNSGLHITGVLGRFAITFLLQTLAVIAGTVLTFLYGFTIDAIGYPMSWFSESWLIFGLYISPYLFALGFIPAFYLNWTKENALLLNHRVQLFLHSHCLYLVIVVSLLTAFNIRSAFLPMMSVLFYTASLYVNLLFTLHNKQLWWIVPHLIGQVLPFMFYSYQAYALFTTFIPMSGRSGSLNNPEYFICGASVGCGILLGGFLVPLLMMFRRSKVLVSSFLAISVIFIILVLTPIAFPYRPETSPQRHWIFHSKRIFRDADNQVTKNESGYFLLPMDRNIPRYVKDNVANMSLAKPLDEDCKVEMFCGLPLFHYRMMDHTNHSIWIPAEDPRLIRTPSLSFLSKENIEQDTVRLSFELTGPDHMNIYINPHSGVKLVNFSFVQIEEAPKNWLPPYFIYFSYAIDPKPLLFFLDLKTSENTNSPILHIGIVGHLMHHNIHQTKEFKEFLSTFPNWTYVTAFMSSYESWHF